MLFPESCTALLSNIMYNFGKLCTISEKLEVIKLFQPLILLLLCICIAFQKALLKKDETNTDLEKSSQLRHNKKTALKKKSHISLCILLLLFAISCQQPSTSQKENEDIAKALETTSKLHTNYPDSALVLLNALWSENERRISDAERFLFYNIQGNIAFVRKEIKTAEEWYFRALQIAENMNNILKKARSIVNIANIRRKQGDQQSAIAYYRQAKTLLGNQIDVWLIHSINQGIGKSFALMGQEDLAHYYSQIALDAAVQIRYEKEQKNRLITRQAKVIQIQRTRTVYWITIGLTTLCVLALVFCFQQRKKRNLTRIVQQYKQLLGYKKKENAQNTSVPKNNTTRKLLRELEHLQHLFEVEKIYRQPKLSIDEVVKKLGTNRTYLSQLFNQELRKPFNDFVNAYRVAEVRELLKDDRYAHYTIQSISEMAGFSSLSVLYTSFKQEVGVTPAEYRNVIRNVGKEVL